MIKRQFFKRAKGNYIISIDGTKYYDFRSNNNILGFSNKKITSKVKNSISSTWNIKENSLEHKRFKIFINNIFGAQYKPFFTLSLKTFFILFFTYLESKKMTYKCNSDFMKEWLQNSIPNYHQYQTQSSNYNILDMVWSNFFTNKKDNIQDKNILSNYYWYSKLNIATNNSEIIIPPSFFSGGFEFVLILIREDNNDFPQYLESIDNIPSLYLKSSMTMYYKINRLFNNNIQPIKLKSDKIIQKDRIFFINDKIINIKTEKSFISKNILINHDAPYYNYLPLVMEESQRKYFSRLTI